MTRPRDMRLIVGLTAVVALSAAACGGDEVVTRGGGSDGTSPIGEWSLVAGPVPDGAIGATTLVIDADGSAHGSTACNSYFVDGPAVDDDRWVATGFAVTEMGCEPERTAAQEEYLRMLATMTRVTVTPAALELNGDDPQETLRFSRVVPPADSDLVATNWVLESLILGEAVSSTIGGADEAVLVLGSDGQLTGSDGCGRFTGSYELEGDRLVVSFADGFDQCDRPLADQAAHVQEVLASSPSAEIDGLRLVLTAPDGRGLDYRDVG